MKWCFWNSGGFRDTAKHSVVSDTIKEHKLDFFAIIETGKDNFLMPFLQNLAGGMDFVWCCLTPIGRSGGILVGFNTQSSTIRQVELSERCVKIHLASKKKNLDRKSVV